MVNINCLTCTLKSAHVKECLFVGVIVEHICVAPRLCDCRSVLKNIDHFNTLASIPKGCLLNVQCKHLFVCMLTSPLHQLCNYYCVLLLHMRCLRRLHLILVRGVFVVYYRLLTVYGEIIVGPGFLAGCIAYLILLFLNLCILNIYRVKIHEKYDHFFIFV